MDHALSDVTVLDLGQVIAMPFCTMLLADLGARVVTAVQRRLPPMNLQSGSAPVHPLSPALLR
jgi:crotonobetainyl-CoA:carnitine CoA-transferase CaiB-like acyl-CoA transferase